MAYPTFAKQPRFKSGEKNLSNTSQKRATFSRGQMPLTLYRHLGNWAVNRLIESRQNAKGQQQDNLNVQELNPEENLDAIIPLVRKQYGISAPGDPAECEAEAVANQVVNMPTPQNDGLQGMASEAPNVWETPSISQKQQTGQSVRNVVHLDLPTSDGLPLESSVAAYMEPRFGHSFENVRVHTSAQSADISRTINARAFTTGRDVYFGHGEYNPQTKEGRKLVAHELTHVIQQGQASKVSKSTISRAKLPMKTLTLNITKLEDSTRSTGVSSASTILENAANVKIKAGKVETLNATKSKALIGNDLILDEFSSAGSPTAEETKLTAENRSPGTITAYFVKSLSRGSHGEAFRPSVFPTIKPSVVLKNGDSPFVAGKPLGHELGHVLLDKGDHPNDTKNLMSYSKTGVALDSTQKTKVRSSSLVK